MPANPDRHHPARLSREAYAEPNRAVFATVCTAGRRPLLTEPARATAVVTALQETCASVGPALIAYCVMPDHVHFVVGTTGRGTVPVLAMRFKGLSSRLLRACGVDGPVWERSYWDRHAREEEDLARWYSMCWRTRCGRGCARR